MVLLVDGCCVAGAGVKGTILVVWAPGNCAEADEHYGDKKWSMTVAPDGETRYAHLVGTSTDNATGRVSQLWGEDPYWKVESEKRMLREREEERLQIQNDIDEANRRRRMQEANDELKQQARDMLIDPETTSMMLKDFAHRMKQIGDHEAKQLEKDLKDKSKQRRMEEDLQKVWEAEAVGKMAEFQKLLDSDDDSEENINKTRRAADEARKMAKTGRNRFKGACADEFDIFARDLDDKVKSLLQPDPTQLHVREAIKRFKALMEDDDGFPGDLLKASEEARAFVAELEGNRKCGKERRDCKQYKSLLKARAVTQKVQIVRLVEKRYNHMKSKFVLMKKFLKNHGVPQAEINNAKRIFEVWETADRHGLELPDTVAGLRA